MPGTWVRALGVAAACTLVGTSAILVLGVRGAGPDGRVAHPWAPIDMWARWDAGWYRFIAERGYAYDPDAQSAVAFFPLYPLLMRGPMALGLATVPSGVAVTLVAGLVAAALFVAWGARVADEPTARRASWLVLLWPFAFYLYGALYSDAVYLALAIGAFLLLERDRVWAATALAALATAARPIAPALVLGLVARQIERRRHRGERLRPTDFAPALGIAGLAAYMAYLGAAFSQPLAFLKTQAAWSQLTGIEAVLKLDLFRHVAGTGRLEDLALPLFHATLAVLVLCLAVPTARRLGLGYGLYTACAMGVPLLTSRDFIGLGRYALAAFPCFLTAELWLRDQPRLRRAWLAVSAALLVLMTARFARGSYTA